MNCQDVKDRLHVYLDETLEAEAQAATQAHLRQCGECARVFAREKAVAEAIRHSLEVVTAGLSLRPDTQRRVLAALESRSAPLNTWRRGWQMFFSTPARVAGASAALLGILLLFAGIQFQWTMTRDPASQEIAQAGPGTYVIDVPIQTQTHVFQRRNNTLVDAIVPSAAVGHARLVEQSERL